MKPSLPQGTRDFSPIETIRRNYIFNTIKSVFTTFGYQSIETPAVENLSTLTGKYGEEGDRLIFKILNSGDFTKKLREEKVDLAQVNKVLPLISEKALRYDLTVPFARYVAMNRDKIVFPFKRFQIQPVWRADRPQKGRYREFWQCDADVVGSNSMLNEAELIQIYDRVFSKLQFPVSILINNRKILSGLAEVANASEFIIDITVALDKIDKIGIEKVNQEMIEKGIPLKSIDALQPLMKFKGNTVEKILFLKEFFHSSSIALQGISEIEKVLSYFTNKNCFELSTAEIQIDLTLARGLNYYTGTILEVKAKNIEFGSIGGGGRYDNLTGIFGLPNVPGVGISFGADRIYDVLLAKELFPENLLTNTEVLFANFSESEELATLPLLDILRNNEIVAEIYHEPAKLKKQFEYADKKGIAFLMIYGEQEINEKNVTVKNLFSGIQIKVPIENLKDFKSFF
jgi:histidyl-tRNA synthetase